VAEETLRVLLVDDNDDHRFLSRRALAALPDGRKVALLLAPDGEDALRQCAADPLPDLVVLDIKMPRKDGFEVLAALRADPRTRGLPVVMFTSSENGGDVARATSLGADDYVTKPLDARAFGDAVRGLVERWRDEALRRRT
jgi:CheY-like chemotaxis protein